MRLSKRLLGSDWVQGLLARVAATYIRFVFKTTRWDYHGRAGFEAAVAQGPLLVAFWHSRILMMPEAWQRPEVRQMLISPHRDGRLIARTIACFDIETIEGSSRRDGAKALRRIVRTLRSGITVGITPDGPRGPRMRAKSGMIVAARLAKVPILPVTYSTARGRNFSSWDRFLLPIPFGRGVLIYGAPINVAAGEIETARQTVEDALNALTAQADQAVGRGITAPAPLDRAALEADDAVT